MNIQEALRRIAPVLAFSGAACATLGDHASMLRSSLFGPKKTEDRLAEEVREARTEQAEAQDEFTTAFHLFQRLTAPQAVELENLDDDLKDSIEDCNEAASRLSERVAVIRTDSELLFNEWRAELEQFSSEDLREKSESMLLDTEQRAGRVIATLERVQAKMEPVLLKLQDYALFFNHNLNPRAIATLEDTYDDFDRELKALDAEIATAQDEMNSFLEALMGRASSQ